MCCCAHAIAGVGEVQCSVWRGVERRDAVQSAACRGDRRVGERCDVRCALCACGGKGVFMWWVDGGVGGAVFNYVCQAAPTGRAFITSAALNSAARTAVWSNGLAFSHASLLPAPLHQCTEYSTKAYFAKQAFQINLG